MLEMDALTVLIIEPQAGMRSSLRDMLKIGGIIKIDFSAGANAAIRAFKNRTYDIVLCEYDLGEGQDGQQLLEDLRHHKLISLSTVFFMVTAERAYEKVVSAAELAPTDYLLKPFAADTLLERVVRAIERRNIFLPVYQLMELGNLRDAIAGCIEGAANYSRHKVDFMRLRAELHVALGEPVEAEQVYTELLSSRAIAWARLGLAKSQFMQGQFAEAESNLQTLVSENNKFLDAYDWLAKTHEAIGQLESAKAVLKDAVAVSPHAIRRLRKLGEISLETGDIETAERSLRQVVSKSRYSDFRDPEDHVRLVQSLLQKGDAAQASMVIRDLDKSMGSLNKTPACRALSNAMVYAHTGDDARAAQALDEAVSACRDSIGMSSNLKIELVRSCLENKLEAGASEVMLDVMRNAPSGPAMQRAMRVFEQAGRSEMAEKLVQDSRRQVIELVAAGAEKAKQGDYRGAVTFMQEAVGKLPDNPQVVFNAALAVLKCLDNLGWEVALGQQARSLIERARILDPANPRLAPLTALHQSMLTKYGILPNRRASAPISGDT
ncbi:MAG: tetratricopeptide repeat protein [Oxalobacteraceae bacterium]